MDQLGLNGATAVEILLSLLVIVLGAFAKSQERRIDKLEKFQETVSAQWLADASNYVTKRDFNTLAQDLKDSLHRIEDSIDRLRDKGR